MYTVFFCYPSGTQVPNPDPGEPTFWYLANLFADLFSHVKCVEVRKTLTCSEDLQNQGWDPVLLGNP